MVNELIQSLTINIPWMGTIIAGVPVWAWLLVPLAFCAAYITALLLARGFRRLLQLMHTRRQWVMAAEMATLHRPLTLLVTAFLFSAALAFLPLGNAVMRVLSYIATLLYVLAFTGTALRLTDYCLRKLQEDFIESSRISAAALIPLFRKLSKVAIVIVAILFALQQWGYDVRALLTALGIGGIAIALASQKSMENLFGGVMLSLDQPIRVGEVGKYGDLAGTVLDIGLRSTRIRTAQNTEVSIPNAQMATLQIESFLPRHQILFNKQIHLRYDAALDELLAVRQEIFQLLASHPEIVEASPRVRVLDLADYAITLDIWAYVNTRDWNAFLEIQEHLLLEMIRIVRDAGTNFAMPSQPLYEMRKNRTTDKK